MWGVRAMAWMVFAGGMPRTEFSDRHTVSVIHGASHVAFDFTSRVIDFLLLSQADDGMLLVLKLYFIFHSMLCIVIVPHFPQNATFLFFNN